MQKVQARLHRNAKATSTLLSAQRSGGGTAATGSGPVSEASIQARLGDAERAGVAAEVEADVPEQVIELRRVGVEDRTSGAG